MQGWMLPARLWWRSRSLSRFPPLAPRLRRNDPRRSRKNEGILVRWLPFRRRPTISNLAPHWPPFSQGLLRSFGGVTRVHLVIERENKGDAVRRRKPEESSE